MDESQNLPELPTKKPRQELEAGQEKGSRRVGVTDGNNQSEGGNQTVLGSDINSYPPPAGTQLEGGRSESVSEGQLCTEPNDSFTHTAVTCKGLTTTSSEYPSQLYQGTNVRVSVSKPTRPGSLGHVLSPPTVPAVTSYPSQASFSPLAQSTVYSAFPPASQGYGLPPFGAMWPGIKTETGLPETPSIGQPGYLNFSTTYTSTQAGQAHYSYPSQGSSFSTSSVYTCIPSGTAATTASTTSAQQEYNYSSLGQNQFPQFYVPPSYTTASLPVTSLEGDGVSVPGYLAPKTEGSTTAGLPRAADASAGLALTPASRDQEETGRRNSGGKAKSKAKKSDSSQSTDNDLERIFLWDLDETIIVFHSLLTGTFAQKFGKDPATVLNLGLQMEELIFELADTHLFFNDLEECDQVHVEDVASDDNGQDLSNYNFVADGFTSQSSGGSGPGSTSGVQGGVEWMRKLAFRYRRLKEIYNGYKGNVGGLLSPMKRELLLRLQADIETVTDSWLSTALKSLLLIQSRGRCVNVLVTTTQLVPALAKVLLYGLGNVFPIENIYSATKIGKESCFERIVSRFGKKVTYVVIGDGRDEEFAAKQLNMPFWRISTHGDLVSLHQALELDFL
ncbi:eyes absent homolog 3 [Megalops cyprinoides]|uniref:eyes absent homolog 3 n=1 Tax=Megalops cyprinoides TaxID=118141 RepID=UPI0018644521|nr:eyes absent homolog 3 [Megalops cyprinoides]